jgi:GxxExxY protein
VTLPLRLEDVDPAINRITGQILDAAIEVHRRLGPGLLEPTYRDCLAHELRLRGFSVETEVYLDLHYKGLLVARAYRVDLLVEGVVIVELKVVDAFAKNHFAQLRTYLKLSQKTVGLLINFDSVPLHKGVRRLVLSGEVV